MNQPARVPPAGGEARICPSSSSCSAIQFGWDVSFLLGDVPEFLLLLVSAVFLMLAALRRERDKSGNDT